MVRTFLIRGMVAGLLAAVAAFVFAFVVGEPAVQRAIDVEESGTSQMAEHTDTATAAAHSHDEEEAPVSRSMQRTFGLATGLGVYGLAIGGIFGLTAAFALGRTKLSERLNAAVVGLLGFVAVVLVPFLKYPANPPAVGSGDTIGRRSGLYLLFLLISLIVMALAVRIYSDLAKTRDPGFALAVAGGVWFVLLVATSWAMPVIDEVGDFPASLLWRFRTASLGTQVVMWGALAASFATLTHLAARKAAGGGAAERELVTAGS